MDEWQRAFVRVRISSLVMASGEHVEGWTTLKYGDRPFMIDFPYTAAGQSKAEAAKAAAAQAQAKTAALAAARPALPGWTAEYAGKERKVFYSRPRNATHPKAAASTYAEMEGVVQKEKEEAAAAELEALRRTVAAAEAKAHADVQAATAAHAAANAAKDAAHAAELAALHQASPSPAVAAL